MPRLKLYGYMATTTAFGNLEAHGRVSVHEIPTILKVGIFFKAINCEIENKWIIRIKLI